MPANDKEARVPIYFTPQDRRHGGGRGSSRRPRASTPRARSPSIKAVDAQRAARRDQGRRATPSGATSSSSAASTQDKTLWNWRKMIVDGQGSTRPARTARSTLLDYDGLARRRRTRSCSAWPRSTRACGLKARLERGRRRGRSRSCHEGFEIGVARTRRHEDGVRLHAAARATSTATARCTARARCGWRRRATRSSRCATSRYARTRRTSSVLLLARTVTRIGDFTEITPELVEGLYAADFDHLQRLYERINTRRRGGGGGGLPGAARSSSRSTSPRSRTGAWGNDAAVSRAAARGDGPPRVSPPLAARHDPRPRARRPPALPPRGGRADELSYGRRTTDATRTADRPGRAAPARSPRSSAARDWTATGRGRGRPA